MKPELIRAIAVTAELTGTEMSETAAKVFADDLALYPLHQVLDALTRCRREVKGRLVLADVLTRIDDGRPGPEEAWAMMPRSEADSAAMTAEMLAGYTVASPLLEQGDAVGARMAFREAYMTACRRNRDAGEPVAWRASLGHSKAGRHEAEQEAERRQAKAEGRPALQLERKDEPLKLEHLETAFHESPPSSPEKARETLAALRGMLGR